MTDYEKSEGQKLGDVCNRLAGMGIDHLAAPYDGSGDEGDVEEATAWATNGDEWNDADEEPVELPDDLDARDIADLMQLLSIGSGWENNEGEHGVIRLDVKAKKIAVERWVRSETVDFDEYALEA